MNTVYQELNLDELGFLGRGKSKHRPRNDPSLYGGDYPFIQTGSVKAANLHIKEYSETYNEIGLAQSKLWGKGTLLITIAANIAETAVLDIDACFPDSIVGFIPDKSKVNSYFIKYYIDFIKREMQSISQGTTQDNLSLDKIRTFKLKIPEKKIVDKITDILLSYDNLIENNNCRIAILEDMAQSLYKEWFVKFRFPGHQNTKFKELSLGLIPEGWEVKQFGGLVDFRRDSVQKGSVSQDRPYMGLEHFPRKSIALSEWELVNEIGSSKLKFKKGDVLFGKIRPYFHKVGVAQTEGLCSSDTFVLRSVQNNLKALVTCIASSDDFVATSTQTSQGTKMPRANWAVLSEYNVCMPSNDLLDKFQNIAGSMIEQIIILSSKQRNLKKQRDLLLPKLISGNIQIS